MDNSRVASFGDDMQHGKSVAIRYIHSGPTFNKQWNDSFVPLRSYKMQGSAPCVAFYINVDAVSQ